MPALTIEQDPQRAVEFINNHDHSDGLGKLIDSNSLKDGAVVASKLGNDIKKFFGIRENSYAYSLGDIVRSPNMPSWAYAECTIVGTTGAVEPPWGIDVGTTVIDGSVTWTIRSVIDAKTVNGKTADNTAGNLVVLGADGKVPVVNLPDVTSGVVLGVENYIINGLKVNSTNGLAVTTTGGRACIGEKCVAVPAQTKTLDPIKTALLYADTNGNIDRVNAQYPTDMIDNNTVGFWVFNKTGNIPNSAVGLSSIAVANDLVPSGGTTLVDGHCDKSVKLDGTSGVLVSQNNAGIPIGSNVREFTIAFTVDAIANRQSVLITNSSGWQILHDSNGNIGFNNGTANYYSGFTVEVGKTYKLKVHLNSGSISIYISGVLIYTGAVTVNTTASNIYVGNYLSGSFFCGVTLHYLEVRNALRTDQATAKIANKLLLPCFYTDTDGSRKNITEILPTNAVAIGIVKTNSTGVLGYNHTDYMYGRREGAYGGNRRVFLGWKAVTTSSGIVYYDNVLGTENINYTVFYKKNIIDTTMAKIDWYQNSSGQNFGVIMNNNQAKIKVTVAANGIVPTYNSPTGNAETSGYIGVYAEVLE